MTDREIMEQALDALDYEAERGNDDGYRQLRDALRERLAQQEQEPVFDCPRCGHCCPPQGIYYTPPQRKPLTDEEIEVLAKKHNGIYYDCDITFARAIEAAHGIKEKNT